MKTAQINIGGEERKIDYSLSGFYDHIQDAAKEKAFDFLNKLKGTEETPYELTSFDWAVLVYGGLNSALDAEMKPNVDFETVKKWLRGVKTSELPNLYKTVLESLADEPGEAPSQPEGSS